MDIPTFEDYLFYLCLIAYILQSRDRVFIMQSPHHLSLSLSFSVSLSSSLFLSLSQSYGYWVSQIKTTLDVLPCFLICLHSLASHQI